MGIGVGTARVERGEWGRGRWGWGGGGDGVWGRNTVEPVRLREAGDFTALGELEWECLAAGRLGMWVECVALRRCR